MSFKYETAKNAAWGDDSHSFINIWVWFEGAQDWTPLSVNPKDITAAHCLELFERAIAGDFGDIKEYSSSSPMDFMMTKPVAPNGVKVPD